MITLKNKHQLIALWTGGMRECPNVIRVGTSEKISSENIIVWIQKHYILTM